MRPAAKLDFAADPFLAIWEITRDCDLACSYCRARDFPPSSDELTTTEGALLDELARMRMPFYMLSGGDPTKREISGNSDLLATPARFDSALDASARQDFSCSRTVCLARTRLNAGDGLVFINNIYPSELLPIACGNVRHDSLRRVYRDHPTFCELRDTQWLKGKCGVSARLRRLPSARLRDDQRLPGRRSHVQL